MSRWNRFRQLSPTQRRLLMQAAALLFGVRFALAFLGFARTRCAVERLANREVRPPRVPVSEREVIWAVEAASHNLPGRMTCLPRALAGSVLFQRAGFPVEMHIGVMRSASGIRAHAWLERESRVVLGDQDDLQEYARLTSPTIDDQEPCSA